MLRLAPLDSFYAAQGGPTSLHDDYIWLELVGQLNRVHSIVRLTNHLKVRFSLEEKPDALSDYVLVVGKKDCDLFPTLR